MQQPIQDNKQRQDQIKQNQKVIALLNSWDQEDPEEQKETLDYLIKALDEDRTSSRKLFS